jgi:tetratricopeptide (TPR) repeat protein
VFCSRLLCAALVLALASCARQQQPGVRRVALGPFENLSVLRDLDWIGTAVPSALQYQLDGSANWKPLVVRNAAEAHTIGASRFVSGYFFNYRGKLRMNGVVEDTSTGKSVLAFEVSGSEREGPLPLLEAMARRLDPKPRPLPTRNEAAMRHFSLARSETDAARAEELLRQSTTADPAFAAAWIQLANLLHSRGDPTAAKSVVAKALERRNQFPELDRRKLDLLAASLENDPVARLRALEAMASANPSDDEVLLSLAQTNYQRRDFQASIRWYRKLLAVEPGRLAAWNSLGYAQALGGDLDGARQSLEQYRRLAPNDVNPLDSLGEVYYLHGKFTQAENAFQEAAFKNSTFLSGAPLLKLTLARLCQGSGQAAQESAGRYFELLGKSSDPSLEIERAQMLFLTGRRREAMDTLRKLLAKPEVAAGAALHLAFAGLECGAREDGRKMLATATRSATTAQAAAGLLLAGFLSMPSASAAEWEARARKVFRPAAPQQFRLLALGEALLFDKHYAEALPHLKAAYDQADPIAGDETREMAAWAALEGGKIEEAAKLLSRWPIPWNNLRGPVQLLLFPRQFYLRGLLAEKQGRIADIRSNYQSFLKYAGDLPDAFGHAAHAREALKR